MCASIESIMHILERSMFETGITCCWSSDILGELFSVYPEKLGLKKNIKMICKYPIMNVVVGVWFSIKDSAHYHH